MRRLRGARLALGDGNGRVEINQSTFGIEGLSIWRLRCGLTIREIESK